jgi:hypothetical protein
MMLLSEYYCQKLIHRRSTIVKEAGVDEGCPSALVAVMNVEAGPQDETAVARERERKRLFSEKHGSFIAV